MTQELIVWGLLGGFAGLVSIMAYAVLANRRPSPYEPQITDGSATQRTDHVTIQPHLETTR